VAYLSFTQTETIPTGYWSKRVHYQVTASDIPAVAVWPAGMRLQAAGPDACTFFSTFTVRHDSLKTPGWHELADFDCSTSALISVLFER
jgi:hypothetical protein